MKYLTKNRVKNILIIFLLISNLATIGTIAFHRWAFNHKYKHFNKEERMDEFVKKDIGFSSDQQLNFEKDKDCFFKVKDSLFKNLRDNKIAVWKEYASLNTDPQKLDSLSLKIAENFVALNKASYKHYFNLLKICNDSQKVKLKEKYKTMAEEEFDCDKKEE